MEGDAKKHVKERIVVKDFRKEREKKVKHKKKNKRSIFSKKGK